MNDVVDASGASVGQDLLQVPFGELVKSIATGIADAQFALDMTGLKIAQAMSGRDADGKVAEENKVKFGGGSYSLLELGFTPTFYQFVDTIIEIKMSISVGKEDSTTRRTFDLNSSGSYSGSVGFMSASGSAKLNVSTVSASFASKYQYSAEGSSLLRTKLVPVPPPAILEERVRALMETNPK